MKNIKVITGIITTLGIFTVLLLVTGALYYTSVSSDRLNFQNTSLLNYQQQQAAAVFQLQPSGGHRVSPGQEKRHSQPASLKPQAASASESNWETFSSLLIVSPDISPSGDLKAHAFRFRYRE